MAWCRIGQEHLATVGSQHCGDTSLDEINPLVDWMEIDRLLAAVNATAKSRLGWPPLALFRALLLARRHDLSDVRQADAQDDRSSFRRLCFSLCDAGVRRRALLRWP